jgi:hypothetical protein
MAVKLTHLLLLYGTAGAREQFENLVVQLIRSERPDAQRIRIVRGDGGIDAHEGSLADPAGVDVFQVKFFPDGIDNSQKAQIRDSFATARDSTKFKTRSWTLCLPNDLSIEESKWFDEWRGKQPIPIGPVWGETKLEGLLFEEKNRGLKEVFFKEEYLQQVRETHATVEKLARNFEERVPRPAQLVIDPRFQAVRVERGHQFSPSHHLMEVAFHFHVYNACPQTVPSWKIVMSIDSPGGKLVERDQFPLLSGDRMEATDRPILPTQHVAAKKNVGILVDRGWPVSRQLAGIFQRMTIVYHGITDNYVGKEKIVKVAEVLDLAQLDEDIRRLG